jgi:hypothetical protein
MMGWLNDFLPKSSKHPGDFHACEFAVPPQYYLVTEDSYTLGAGRAIFFW